MTAARSPRTLAGDGVTVLLGEAAAATLPAGTDLVVTSPGWRPSAPLLAAAAAAGVEVMGDVELAWRLRPSLAGGGRQRWLAVTGTNGKTTTVRMLAADARPRPGYRAVAAGNVGTSLVDVVTEPEPYEVVAVELSSFQLHWSSTIEPFAAVVLNVAAHHLDWHGTMEAYAADKARIFAPGTIAIGNADDERSARMAQRGRRRAVSVPARRAAARRARRGGRLPRRPRLRRARPGRRRPAGRRGRPARARPGGRVPGARAAHRRGRARRGRAGPGVRRAARGGQRRAGRVPARPAPDQPGRQRGRGRLHRRLQGDQPARGRGVARRLRPGRVGRGRAAQGRGGRPGRAGRRGGRPAARGRPVRRRPGDNRRGTGATRAGGPGG